MGVGRGGEGTYAVVHDEVGAGVALGVGGVVDVFVHLVCEEDLLWL